MRSATSAAATMCVCLGMGFAVRGACAGAQRQQALLRGVDANYCLEMEKGGATWSWDGKPTDLFVGMARQGVRELRVRLWTKDGGPDGRIYATEVVKRAIRAGLNPHLVLFLSDDWSDLEKQPVPAAWKDLSFEERTAAVRDHSRDTVAHFRKAGLRSHVYEIGNEIDFGVCGEYPGQPSEKDTAALSKHLWPRSAAIILASEAGVKQADPAAKFMLHIAHWWDAEFCVAFFRSMLDQGVQIDYAGLTYFPSSNIGGSRTMQQFGGTVSRLAKAIGRPIVVAETGYPCTADFGGQFAGWKHAVPGYPLTADGQYRWLADFIRWCESRRDISAVYYWSPEWCGDGMWSAFALFDANGHARPAWAAFGGSARKERRGK